MEEARAVAVSPRHSILLATELFLLIEKAPRTDFIVRTVAHREANGLPLMSAELVIASIETREKHEAAKTYPLHFRKTYFPGRLYEDPSIEYQNHLAASALCATPPPIGYGPRVFRSCLIPGQPFPRISPFGGEPPDSNIDKAQKLPLASAAGLWRLAEETYAQLVGLHAGGMVHGDAQLHNCIVCPAPLEPILIDFEAAAQKGAVPDEEWEKRRRSDLEPLLREAIYLQCTLGRQPSALGEAAWQQMPQLFKSPDRFQRAIEAQGGV
jgi:hypothetical protein